MAYDKHLKSLFKKLEKDKDILVFSADQATLPPRVRTSSPSANWAMDGGMVPGRVYVFEGPKSGGKSFFALSCIADLLRAQPDGVAFWFDSEFSFSDHFADILMTEEERKRLIVIQTSDPTKIFDYFHDTLGPLMEPKVVEKEGEKGEEGEDKKPKVDPLKVVACVVDSIQSIVDPQEAAAESTADAQWASKARYLQRAFNRVTPLSRRQEVTWIYISQVRQNMDQAAVKGGDKWSITGGEAFKHLTDCDMQFSVVGGKDAKIVDESIKNMNDSALRVGHTIRATNKKHRIGHPFRVAEFKLNYDKGIVCIHEELVHLANKLKLLTKDGNTYFFNGQKLGVGLPKVLELVEKSPALQEAFRASIEAWKPAEDATPSIETEAPIVAEEE